MNLDEAHAIIDPFYNLFRSATRDWDAGFGVLAEDWRSYYTNDLYRTKEDTRPYIGGLFELVPDIDVEIHQLYLAGNTIVARTTLSGTPAKDFMVPYQGRKFSIMTLDLHTVNDEGKIASLYHLEDWGIAIRQLNGEEPA